jgi:hypothetical protein
MKSSEEQNPNYYLVLYVQGMRWREEQDPSLSYAYMNYPLTCKRAMYAKNENWRRPNPEILFSKPYHHRSLTSRWYIQLETREQDQDSNFYSVGYTNHLLTYKRVAYTKVKWDRIAIETEDRAPIQYSVR